MTVESSSPDLADLDPEMLNALLAEAGQANLEPLSPEKALEMYEQLREDELTNSTLKTHRSRLAFFIDWCNQNNLDNLNELSGRDLQLYRQWRKDGLTISSLESNMRTLRTFLRKCVAFDGVRPDIPEKVEVPSVSPDENSRDVIVAADRTEAILEHLDKYEYGTIEHVVWLLTTSTGLRLGSVQALDVGDYTSTTDGGDLQLENRPESETRLKNGDNSERLIHLSEYVSEVLDDFLADQRPDVTDEYGRAPLVATEYGRVAESTLRKYAYKWTRPCMTGSCPHGVEAEAVDDCDAMATASTAYKCPSSSSLHAIRRGYITNELDAGVPKDVVGDRCDVTPDVIDAHYDERDAEEKMQLRKEIRESIYDDTESAGYGR
jgi:site-specific recombinase XerD